VKGEGWVGRKVGGGSKGVIEIDVDKEIDSGEHRSEVTQDTVGTREHEQRLVNTGGIEWNEIGNEGNKL
jgi:hypothetical protein